MLGKQEFETSPDPARERDIADSRELDRYEMEKAHAKNLPTAERIRAVRDNERKRMHYIANRRV